MGKGQSESVDCAHHPICWVISVAWSPPEGPKDGQHAVCPSQSASLSLHLSSPAKIIPQSGSPDSQRLADIGRDEALRGLAPCASHLPHLRPIATVFFARPA
ncbi:hypothetical protein CABS01_02694 [Colletotrichum abscissum]|uniref:uncharacterized protein n=1 Tax=Colletotrichum abscissum TaxID=1671311 RepID=UPI0027D51F93|nr:uncharacterized protein CABS01_02694 [Colletotrichum abscissum]KAI3539761.1 hypothetical protein CSPX01_08717 [Colletotrichum filicis]KAK1482958.1 hypothetical protein CABS01_02694 [Colletotrichum abscissum]